MDFFFEKTGIKGLEPKNRFMRSATWEGLADEEGRVTGRLTDMLGRLARGGVGLIVTGFAYVRKDGQAMPFQTGIHHDGLLPELSELTREVRRAGAGIVMQIVHGGALARPRLAEVDVPSGPSAVMPPGIKAAPKELTVGAIQDIIEDFGRAAARVRAAGFDGVQLHAAHGYLFSQFLSPAFNQRGDRYGGNLLNRARILYETFEAVRGTVGDDFPVFIKINSRDHAPGGLELEESIRVTRNLAEMGLDGVEVSGGLPFSGEMGAVRQDVDSPEKEAYFRLAGAAFKSRLGIPVMLVGGVRSPQVIKEIHEHNQADFISLSRPLIREPELVSRWADGDLSPSTCTSCNDCRRPGLLGRGVYCIHLKKEGEN